MSTDARPLSGAARKNESQNAGGNKVATGRAGVRLNPPDSPSAASVSQSHPPTPLDAAGAARRDHNPRVAGSSPASGTHESPANAGFLLSRAPPWRWGWQPKWQPAKPAAEDAIKVAAPELIEDTHDPTAYVRREFLNLPTI